MREELFIYRPLEIVAAPAPALVPLPDTAEAVRRWRRDGDYRIDPNLVLLGLQTGDPAQRERFVTAVRRASARGPAGREALAMLSEIRPRASPTGAFCAWARERAAREEDGAREVFLWLLSECGEPRDAERFEGAPAGARIIWLARQVARGQLERIDRRAFDEAHRFLIGAVDDGAGAEEILAARSVLGARDDAHAAEILISLIERFPDEREVQVPWLARHTSERARAIFDAFYEGHGEDPAQVRAQIMNAPHPAPGEQEIDLELTWTSCDAIRALGELIPRTLSDVTFTVGPYTRSGHFDVHAYTRGRRFTSRVHVVSSDFIDDFDALLGFFNSLARELGSAERIVKVQTDGQYVLVRAGPMDELASLVEQGALRLDPSRTSEVEPLPPQLEGLGGAGRRALGPGDWIAVDAAGELALILADHLEVALRPWPHEQESGLAASALHVIESTRIRAELERRRWPRRVRPGAPHLVVLRAGAPRTEALQEWLEIVSADAWLDGTPRAVVEIVDEEDPEQIELLRSSPAIAAVVPLTDDRLDRLAVELGLYVYVGDSFEVHDEEIRMVLRRVASPERPLRIEDVDDHFVPDRGSDQSTRALIRSARFRTRFRDAEVLRTADELVMEY